MNIITMEVTVIVRVTFSLNNSVVDMNGKIKKEKKHIVLLRMLFVSF